MKGKQPSKPSKVDYYNSQGEQSITSIKYGSPQLHNGLSPSRSLSSNTNQDANIAYKMQRQEIKRAKKSDLDHLYKQNYQPAKFSKAVQYRNSRSYMKKLPSGHYKELDTYEDTEELKNFGLGTYFYVEFFRRLMWLYFVMTLIQGITIYINWMGSGMGSYSSTFSTYLIKTTLGNYSGNVLSSYDGYIVTIVPAVNYLAMMLFYFIWKGHYFGTISDQEDDNADVKPEKFCLQVVGLEESYVNEEELKSFFSSFGPVYEVSVVRRYKNKLSYFQELDDLEQQIREEQLQLVLGGGDKSDLNSLKRQKEKLQKFINTLKIYPKTTQAFIHFQYQKSKIDCMSYFNNHYLFDTCGHQCVRSICCCCVIQPQQKYLFRGEKLQIKNQKVPTPQDINWGSYELSPCSKFFRILFSALIIIIFLAISCAIIGICSIYINTHSGNCDGVTIPTTTTAAKSTTNSSVLTCYCYSNLIASFSDSEISTICQSYRSGILASQGIQYGVIATSAITNYIFGFIVNKLVNCVRPVSRSSGLLTKTTIYTIFLILNSVFIPILIYADIFGFQPSKYVSFLTIISSSLKSFLSVESISLLPTFNKSWYVLVSPVFVNYVIIDTVITWIFLLVDKCSSSYSELQDDQGKILQKNMNQKITKYKLDVYKEAATMYLIIFMTAFFWVGIPVLVPLGLINIFSRYTVNRILLQGNSTKIQGLGEQFMSLSILILPLMLIFFPIFGEWMFTANTSIYPDVLPMTFPLFNGLSWILDRQLYLPFYIILSLIAMIEFFFWNTLVRFFSWLSSLCYERKQVMRPQHTRPFVQYTKGMNILYSYNIRNNDEKRNVMLNIEKYLVDKELE